MFTLVSTIGHCLILAQEIGETNTGEPIFSFFGAFMITQDGKPACSFGEAQDMVRITKSRNTHDELIGFCQGYSSAASERFGVAQGNWRFPGNFGRDQVKEISLEEKNKILFPTL